MKTLSQSLLLVTAILMSYTNQAYAQPGKTNPAARIQALKIATFTRILDLSPEEAKGFWPLYDDYQDALTDLKFDEMKFRKKLENKTTEISEDDYKAAIDMHLEIEQKRLNLTTAFYKKCQSVLTYEKIFLIQKAEKTFKKELLERIKKQQGGKKPGMR